MLCASLASRNEDITNEASGEPTDAQVIGHAQMESPSDAVSRATLDALSALVTEIKALRPQPGQHVGQQNSIAEAPSLPIVRISPTATAWAAGESDAKKRRLSWPRVLSKRLKEMCDPKGQAAFNSWAAMREKMPDTVKVYKQGLSFILSCVEIHGGDGTWLSLILALYRQGVFTKLFALPLFKRMRSFQRKAYDALAAMLKHLSLECNKKGLPIKDLLHNG